MNVCYNILFNIPIKAHGNKFVTTFGCVCCFYLVEVVDCLTLELECFFNHFVYLSFPLSDYSIPDFRIKSTVKMHKLCGSNLCKLPIDRKMRRATPGRATPNKKAPLMRVVPEFFQFLRCLHILL